MSKWGQIKFFTLCSYVLCFVNKLSSVIRAVRSSEDVRFVHKCVRTLFSLNLHFPRRALSMTHTLHVTQHSVHVPMTQLCLDHEISELHDRARMTVIRCVKWMCAEFAVHEIQFSSIEIHSFE